MRKIRRVIIILSGLLVVAPVGASYLGAWLLETQLEALFAKETGCDVQIDSASLQLFPLIGEVRGVSLRAPQESDREGFFADRITVWIKYRDLLSRRVILRDLTFEGARAVSLSTDSAFFRTLRFITHSDENEDEIAKDPSKENPLFVTTVTILGPTDNRDSLEILHKEFRFIWHKLNFELRRSEIRPRGVREKPTFYLSAYTKDFDLTLPTGRKMRFGSTSVDGSIGNGIFAIEKSSIDHLAPGDNTIVASGKMELDGPGRYDLALHVEASNEGTLRLFPELESVIREHIVSLQMDGHLSGELEHPIFEASVVLPLEKQFPVGNCFLRATGFDFRIDPDRVTVSRGLLESQSGELFRPNLDADILLRNPYPIRARFDLDARSDEAFWHACTPPGTNRVIPQVSIALDGKGVPLYLDGKLYGELPSVEYGTEVISGTGQFSTDEVLVALAESFERGSPRGGRAAIALDLKRNLTSPVWDISSFQAIDYPLHRILTRVQPFAPDVAKRLTPCLQESAAVNAEGALKLGGVGDVTGHLKLRLENLRFGTLPVSEAAADFSFEPTAKTLKNGRLAFPGGTLLAEASLGGKGELHTAFTAEQVNVADMRKYLPRIPKTFRTANFAGKLAGTLEEPTGETELSIVTEAAPDTPLSASAKFARGVVEIESSLGAPGSLVRLLYPVSLRGGEKLAVTGDFTDFPLGRAASHFSGSPLAGSLTAALRYEAPRDKPLNGKGELRVSKIQLSGENLEARNPAPLLASFRDGAVHFDDVRMQLEGHELLLGGSLSVEKGWNARVEGSWDIGGLIPRFSGVEQISGNVLASVSLTGAVTTPGIRGELSLANGSISFRTAKRIFGVSELQAHGTLREQDLILTGLQAQAEGGSITGSGEITGLLTPNARGGEIRFRIEDVVLEPIENLDVVISGEPTLNFVPDTRPELRGAFQITSGTYEEKITLSEIIRNATRTIAGLNARDQYQRREQRDAPQGEGVNLNFSVNADDSVLISTDVLETSLSANLNVGGTTRAPKITGAITANQGAFGIGANRFDLLTGRLAFTGEEGEINPQVSVLGEGALGTGGDVQRVQLSVSGTLSDPQVSFGSDRQLSDSEILSLLGGTRSRPNASVLSIRSGQGGTFERTLTGVTGFQTIDVGYGYSSTTGEYVPKITGSRPVLGKLRLSVDSELGGHQSSSAGFRYPLTDRTDAFTAWKNAPSLEKPESNTGSFDVGVRFTETFPDLGIIPRSIIRSLPFGKNGHGQTEGEKR